MEIRVSVSSRLLVRLSLYSLLGRRENRCSGVLLFKTIDAKRVYTLQNVTESVCAYGKWCACYAFRSSSSQQKNFPAGGLFSPKTSWTYCIDLSNYKFYDFTFTGYNILYISTVPVYWVVKVIRLIKNKKRRTAVMFLYLHAYVQGTSV